MCPRLGRSRYSRTKRSCHGLHTLVWQECQVLTIIQVSSMISDGFQGQTAYSGWKEFAKPQKGDVVYVSSAAGQSTCLRRMYPRAHRLCCRAHRGVHRAAREGGRLPGHRVCRLRGEARVPARHRRKPCSVHPCLGDIEITCLSPRHGTNVVHLPPTDVHLQLLTAILTQS